MKAQNLAKKIAVQLSDIENSLQEMMKDIDLLIDSEEDNRQQITEIQKLYKKLKQYYLANKSLLGSTVVAFEKKMTQIDQSFVSFETATNDGNYFAAREILMMMKEEIEYEKWKMEEVPKLLIQIESEIPSQLEELTQGIKEMEEDGYVLDHFFFKQNISDLRNRLDKMFPVVEEGNVEAATIPIADIFNEIEQIYVTLEEEVLARQYVTYELTTIEDAVDFLYEQFTALKQEVNTVKLSYRIPEDELRLHVKLEKQLKDLTHKLKVIEDVTTNKKQSYIAQKKSIEEFKIEVMERETAVENCHQTLTTLRKDEIRVKESLHGLRSKIRQGQRLIKRSNIPGLPESILLKLEKAEKSILAVDEKTKHIPLVMEDISASMEEALAHVNDVDSLVTSTIEQALAAEQVIQYGNRYRNSYPLIHEELLKAEQFFRIYEYEEALDIAYKAVEEVDPNGLEKLQITSSEKV
jgi:septation ring formation regulator